MSALEVKNTLIFLIIQSAGVYKVTRSVAMQ